MKYYLDTEFIEGFHKPIFGKNRHFIDLISIGVVAEDGREYYAISNEYAYGDADDWVKENVILPAYKSMVSGDARNQFDSSNFHRHFGKSVNQIRYDIFCFFFPGLSQEWIGATDEMWNMDKVETVELYGYYSAYDHVLLCSIFGRMIDLPNGVPMYTKDLKQMMDETGLTKEWKQFHCPDPEGEHNALVDARWNKKLHEAILQASKQVNS